MDAMAEMEGVNQTILWYGTGWNWTIHYTLPGHAPSGRSAQAR